VIYYLFAPPYGSSFKGAIELRGLNAGRAYKVTDYENNASYGTFSGPTVSLTVTIPTNDPLLLKAAPATGGSDTYLPLILKGTALALPDPGALDGVSG
jgi:hypothetical protein